MTIRASMLWRRLDVPGHDACRLEGGDSGWLIEGTAVFRQDGAVASLSYRVTCDLGWYGQHGQVSGWLDDRSVEVRIVRAGGMWTLNGVAAAGLERCVDLDLGFTPATNLLHLRRLALAEGQKAEVPVAWFDMSAGTLSLLPQRYERRDEETYWYEAPTVGYTAALKVTSTGFIRDYPGLWEMEP